MAIYHCSVKTIGRSGGSSSVNSAAYRSGEKLFDESLGKTFFYSGKSQDVMHKEIMAPGNAPEWVFSREKLWNAVESVEARKDSQLAREIEISLPREFTTDQNIALVKEYVQEQFVDRGMVADVCLHYGRKGENYNPHAHVMLTMRDVGSDGFGKKNVSWNDRGLLNEWRENWADLSNKHLAINGFDLSIDHRSLAAQGIELVPQNVELPADAKDRLTEQRERQLIIMRENGERLISNPGIALSAITKSQSTFSDRDIARYLHSRTVDKEQFDLALSKVKACDELMRIVLDQGREEKVVDRALYTTKEMIGLEKEMFTSACDKAFENNFALKDNSEAVKEECRSKGLSLEQGAAVEYLTRSNDLVCVVGYAGTGKTHMLNTAREIWERNGYKVHGAALSGIAAQGLEQGAGIESRTVARRLIDWENGRAKLGSRDILVVDEAGMLSTRDLSRVITEVKSSGAKIVSLGDFHQLQAIGSGASFRGIVERVGALEMSDVRRQEVSWQRDATKMFAVGEVKEALASYEHAGKTHGFASLKIAKDKMVSDWSKHLSKNGDGALESQIMLAHKRSDVHDLNSMAREVLKSQDMLGDGITVETVNGEREISKGDQIYFLRNDNRLSVKNGTLAEVDSVSEDGSIVAKVKEISMEDPNDSRPVSFNIKDYKHIDHGYASTIHKSQGVTGDRTYMLVTCSFDKHLAYVGMSRHVKEANMYWSKEDFTDFKDLQDCLSRDRSKDNALDYVDDSISYRFADRGEHEVAIDGIAKEQQLEVESKAEFEGQYNGGDVVQEVDDIDLGIDKDALIESLEKADDREHEVEHSAVEEHEREEAQQQEFDGELSKSDDIDPESLEKESSKELSFEEMLKEHSSSKENVLEVDRSELFRDIAARDASRESSFKTEKEEFVSDYSNRNNENSIEKTEDVFDRLEDRRLYNKAVSALEDWHRCSIDREIKVGIVLNYISNEKIGDTHYALMQEANSENMKLIESDKCLNIDVDNEATIVNRFNEETQKLETFAVPTERELWHRDVKHLTDEFAKEITREISDGEFGKHMGTTEVRDKEYIVMEQYDKVLLLDTSLVPEHLKEGDYMRIMKSEDLSRDRDDHISEFTVSHDRDKHQEREIEKSQERHRRKN